MDLPWYAWLGITVVGIGVGIPLIAYFFMAVIGAIAFGFASLVVFWVIIIQGILEIFRTGKKSSGRKEKRSSLWQ